MVTRPSARFFVIMAGGSGTRFWPSSRATRPKQLLSLGQSGETLLQAAVRRACQQVGPGNVLVVASARHADATRAQLPQLPDENLLLEPQGRNTAPCIAWALSHVRRRDPRALVGVLPADPHIGDEAAFAAALELALSAAEDGPVVTIGIQPSRPEPGYGYVERGAPVREGVERVTAFIEKPDPAHARELSESGRHLWNSGMFFFRADVMLELLAEHQPALGAFVAACDTAAARGDELRLVEERYATLPSISIDHGVMEKAHDVVVVPADFGWDDIGSWSAAWALAPKDAADNAARGDALFLDSKGCYVSGPEGKLIAVLGARDLVVVDTPDALLILPRGRAQEVRAIVAALKDDPERRGYL